MSYQAIEALVSELAVAMRNNTPRHDSYVQNLLLRAHEALTARQATASMPREVTDTQRLDMIGALVDEQGFVYLHRNRPRGLGLNTSGENLREDLDGLMQRRADKSLKTGAQPPAAQTEDLAGAVWDGPNTASQVDPCMGLPAKSNHQLEN